MGRCGRGRRSTRPPVRRAQTKWRLYPTPTPALALAPALALPLPLPLALPLPLPLPLPLALLCGDEVTLLAPCVATRGDTREI